MESPTGTLSTFLADLTYEKIPLEVAERAKLVFLDTIGAAVAGSQTKEGMIAVRLAQKLKGKEESTIIASELKADCLYAALANGIMSHALELDDGNRFAQGHPGVSVIPTVLALGENEKITGKSAIVAIVAGYESFGRIGAAGNPSHFNRGFHTTGTCGTFAAASAAGKILGLKASEMVEALGIAGSQSAGLFAFMANGAMTKVLHPGKAAHSGILSAYLVKEGFTGPTTVLEDSRGFYRACADHFSPERIVSGLGERFEIMNTYVKYHASCRHTHSAIDGVIVLVCENQIDPEEIEKIVVRTYSIAAKLVDGKDITTPLSGKMSLPYCIAMAVMDGEVGLNQFSTARLHDERVLKLMNRVEVLPDKELDGFVPKHRGARVEIMMMNGQRYEKEVLDAKGEPENPGSVDDQLRKFKDCAAPILGNDRVDEIIRMGQILEELEDLSGFAALLRK